jgi:hypothetical protein
MRNVASVGIDVRWRTTHAHDRTRVRRYSNEPPVLGRHDGPRHVLNDESRLHAVDPVGTWLNMTSAARIRGARAAVDGLRLESLGFETNRGLAQVPQGFDG